MQRHEMIGQEPQSEGYNYRKAVGFLRYDEHAYPISSSPRSPRLVIRYKASFSSRTEIAT